MSKTAQNAESAPKAKPGIFVVMGQYNPERGYRGNECALLSSKIFPSADAATAELKKVLAGNSNLGSNYTSFFVMNAQLAVRVKTEMETKEL